jgi:ribosomal protein S18 acetylase RimI-like enzyme
VDVVRHATPAYVSALTRTFTRAFADDPVMCWLFRDEATRDDGLAAFFTVAVGAGLRRGHTYEAAGGRAACIWSPPGVELFDARSGQRLLGAISEHVGADAPPRIEAMLSMQAMHPQDPPSFYLFSVAVDPETQGQGLGGKLLREVLDVCDRQQFPAYLESSSPRNQLLYERHGFRSVDTYTFPDGPVATAMWRGPSAQPAA